MTEGGRPSARGRVRRRLVIPPVGPGAGSAKAGIHGGKGRVLGVRLEPTAQALRPHGNKNRDTNMDSRFRGNDEGGGGRDGLPRAVVTGLPRHSPAFAGAGSTRPGISRAQSAKPTPTRTFRDFFTRFFAGMTRGLAPTPQEGHRLEGDRPTIRHSRERACEETLGVSASSRWPSRGRCPGVPPPPRHSRESGNPYSYFDSCFRGDEGPVTSARGKPSVEADTPKDPSFPALDSRFRGNDEGGGPRRPPSGRRHGPPSSFPRFRGTGSARSGISRAWSAEPTPTRTCRDFFTRSKAGIQRL